MGGAKSPGLIEDRSLQRGQTTDMQRERERGPILTERGHYQVASDGVGGGFNPDLIVVLGGDI